MLRKRSAFTKSILVTKPTNRSCSVTSNASTSTKLLLASATDSETNGSITLAKNSDGGAYIKTGLSDTYIAIKAC